MKTFSIILMRQAYLGVQRELIEATRVMVKEVNLEFGEGIMLPEYT